MASSSEIINGFGLKSGTEIKLGTHTFIIKKSHTEPTITKKEKESYEYPLQFTLVPSSPSSSSLTSANVQSLFSSFLSNPKVIYNAYGSPYDCKFIKFSCKSEEKVKKGAKAKKQKTEEKSGDDVEIFFIIDSTASANRNHELPTKSQSNAAATAVPIEIRKLYISDGFEIRKSAFSNAKCAHCHGSVEAGEYIAKASNPSGNIPAGWIMLSCLRKLKPLDEAGAIAAAAEKKNKSKTPAKKSSKKSDGMAVEKEKKGRKAAPGTPPINIRKLYSNDYDIRTSAFEGSYCAICDNIMNKGEWISKDNKNEESGGWSHFNCLRKTFTKDGDDLEDIPEDEDEEEMKAFIDDEENEGNEEDEEKEWEEDDDEEENEEEKEEEEEEEKQKGKKGDDGKKRKR